MASSQSYAGGGFIPGQPGAPPPPGPIPGYPPYGFQVPPPVPGQSGMYGTSSVEDPLSEVKGFDFDDKSIRTGFIRKVYTILMCQLLITLSMIAVFLYHKPTQRWVMTHPEMFWISFGMTLVLIIAMTCCTNVRRKSPMNFIFLFLFTLAEGFLLATAASTYEAQEVLLAVGITAAVCLALTIFAFQTKYDFTGLHTYLFVALIVFLIFGLIAMFWKGKIVSLVYASIGALLFSAYLVYDTQMMVGGRKHSIYPEEYIFAALSLYLDIANLFLYILSIINISRD